jgi:uncharacterized protein (TIGR02145 family)
MKHAELELGGKVYKTTIINNKLWMAENLTLLVKESWFYDDNAQHGARYGRLYSWQAALDACPEGWRLPSVDEWQEMIDSLGGMDAAYPVLTSPDGFNPVFGGYRTYNGEYMSIDRAADFWTSTPAGDANAWLFYFISKMEKVHRIIDDKRCGFSVRYISDL